MSKSITTDDIKEKSKVRELLTFTMHYALVNGRQPLMKYNYV